MVKVSHLPSFNLCLICRQDKDSKDEAAKAEKELEEIRKVIEESGGKLSNRVLQCDVRKQIIFFVRCTYSQIKIWFFQNNGMKRKFIVMPSVEKISHWGFVILDVFCLWMWGSSQVIDQWFWSCLSNVHHLHPKRSITTPSALTQKKCFFNWCFLPFSASQTFFVV